MASYFALTILFPYFLNISNTALLQDSGQYQTLWLAQENNTD
jgi:hypothetical protein